MNETIKSILFGIFTFFLIISSASLAFILFNQPVDEYQMEIQRDRIETQMIQREEELKEQQEPEFIPPPPIPEDRNEFKPRFRPFRRILDR